MQLMPLVLKSATLVEAIKAVPQVMEASVKLYDRVRGRPQRRPPRDNAVADAVPTLREDITELQERLDSLETTDKTQTELIAHMTRHEAALLRWLIGLGLTTILTGAAAITALVVAVWP